MFILLLLTLAYIQYKHILFCEFIRFSSFYKLHENVYVSPGIPMEHKRRILIMLQSAEYRIRDFWRERRGNARVIICSNPEEYQKYCHSKEGAGCSLGTLYGSTFIVLNYRDMNTDVVAHEMSHIELFQRLGWKTTTFDIPQWFNEGLAMMLDRRFVKTTDSVSRYDYYLEAWHQKTKPPAKRLTLGEISTLKGFFDGDDRHIALAYITAATEVSFWLKNVGRRGLIEFLEKTGRKEGFQVYYELEKAALSSTKNPSNPIRELEKMIPGE